MKRLAYIMIAMLLSVSMYSRAEETITVSATNSDISASLDLKAVAKLFAGCKNIEEFEMQLNNPDSAFTNLDLNGDGDIDYLRVVETGSGNSRLIVIQAILAKDIYQDVASIYVERDEATNNVRVQVVGDEYVYGRNYVIEPVYVYRPVIYDWFWGPHWVCWSSPFYWGYWPGWWYAHPCWEMGWYTHHIHVYHHYYPACSFRYAQTASPRVRTMSSGVSRRDYASSHPERSFSTRYAGTQMNNARDVSRTSAQARGTSTRATAMGAETGRTTATGTRSAESTRQQAAVSSRTFGSTNVASTRTQSASMGTSTRTQSATTGSSTRSQVATTGTSSRTQSATVAGTSSRSQATSSRSQSASAYSGSSTRSSSASYSGSSRSTSSYGGSSYSGGYSGGSTRSTSSYSGGSTRSYSGGGYSGGGYSGGSTRGGGYSGGGSSRR